MKDDELNISDDTSGRYQVIDPDNPFELQTRGGTFGGPNDTEDDGRFYFGGQSIMPDGSINPEHYAALPKELFDKGIVHPGQVFAVKNPENGERAFVVARDVGPHDPDPSSPANRRGVDVSPVVAKLLNYHTDKPLVVDLRMHGVAPHADLSAQGRAPVIFPHPDGDGTPPMQGDELSEAMGDPAQPSVPQLPGTIPADPRTAAEVPETAQGLTPIGAPPPAMDSGADLGQQEVEQQTEDLQDTADQNQVDAGLVPQKGAGPSTLVFPGERPKVKSTMADGSVLFDNGIHAYSDHIEREIGGRRYAEYPGQHPVNITPTSSILARAITAGVSPYNKEAGRPLTDNELIDAIGQKMHEQTGEDLDPNVHGEEALKGLSSQDANLVRGLATYQLPTSSYGISRSPKMQQLLGRVLAFNPSFDAKQYDVMKNTMKEFTSTSQQKAGGNIISLNTAIAHLHALDEAAAGLNNHGWQTGNRLDNFVANNMGKPEVAKFNEIRNKVSTELARTFSGGVPTNFSVQEQMDSLNSAQSPEQLKAVIRRAIPDLVKGRLDELNQFYEDNVGKPPPKPLLTSQSVAHLKAMGVSISGDKQLVEGHVYPTKDGKHKVLFKDGQLVPLN